MQRLPRHLGIHSGGMVICDRPVGEVCPVEWARMPGRTVLQWDKDDCAYAGLVKFDLLGLGMLAALHDCFDLVTEHYGERWTMSSIPQEDPAVYQMLAEADTVGVFQVESRAQMATLPRLRPQQFYDLVIEVALIRPGPIQGGSVHPYLRRHDGLEEAAMPHESMRPALGKTLGVPLFQEQMMQLAIDCAGFTPTEADRLRQAMSAKRAPERIEELRQRLLDGMAERGIGAAMAEDIYAKILAFSSYGFPESHAISFAYLVYASAWLKLYYPAAFTAALLRNQPMGFYAPHSLINDARRHGVTVHGVDVNASDALATLEGSYRPSRPDRLGLAGGIRLGLSAVRHLGRAAAERVAAGLALPGPGGLRRPDAPAGRGAGGAGHRGRVRLLRAQPARRAVGGGGRRLAARGAAARHHHRADAPPLPDMTPAEETLADLWATSTYGTHPVAHIRPRCGPPGADRAGDQSAADGTEVAVAGLVTHRQRPPTARGVVFLSLEDETGHGERHLPAPGVGAPPAAWPRRRPPCSSGAGSSGPAAPSTCSPPPCGRSGWRRPSPAPPRAGTSAEPAGVPRGNIYGESHKDDLSGYSTVM